MSVCNTPFVCFPTIVNPQGVLNDIPLKGTHAHSFVSSYTDLSDLRNRKMKKRNSDDEVCLFVLLGFLLL